jgi:integrin beta 3
MTRDFSLLLKTLADETKAYLAPHLARLQELSIRLYALETKAPLSGKDGRDGLDGKDGANGLDGKDGSEGPAGRDGIDGKDGAPGQDGAPGPQGAPGRDGADGAVGPVGPAGKDGLDGLHGKDGANGIDGKDGAKGLDGRDGLPGRDGFPGAIGEKGLDGKDGRDGKDGLDGFGFDDLAMEYDGARTFAVKFSKGDRTKSFAFAVPVMLFQGIYTEGQPYVCGDVVQFGGNLYYAKTSTVMRPTEVGDGMKDWTLVVRRGRDGKREPR